MPVCIAKTQYSFSDDAKKLGAPEGFTLTIRSVKVSASAVSMIRFFVSRAMSSLQSNHSVTSL